MTTARAAENYSPPAAERERHARAQLTTQLQPPPVDWCHGFALLFGISSGSSLLSMKATSSSQASSVVLALLSTLSSSWSRAFSACTFFSCASDMLLRKRRRR
uniref:Uncharacterized protein n=1 Tax=Phaeomonas parva TaxID=124430 RepID=A0A6U4FVZ6_9STRA